MLPYRVGLELVSWFGRCVLCRTRAIEAGYLCDDCDVCQHWLPAPFEVPVLDNKSLTVWSASFYQGTMRHAIMQFKDHETLHALPFLVHALTKLVSRVTHLPADTLIVPVPTTQGRLTKRGFYPVLILARYFSALTGFGLYQGMVRPFESSHQRGLDRTERLQNLQGAFEVQHLPTTKHFLLFDDVATTGATLAEMAKALWQVCPEATISAVCLAHGSSWFLGGVARQEVDDKL